MQRSNYIAESVSWVTASWQDWQHSLGIRLWCCPSCGLYGWVCDIAEFSFDLDQAVDYHDYHIDEHPDVQIKHIATHNVILLARFEGA